MLQSLHIQNYALIDHLDIDFHPGFSVITGETGAGKSIILGALGMILGQRADTRSIQPEAKRCIVEAIFDLSGFDASSFFETNNLDFDGVECIVRRELSQNGKSRAFINDTPVSAGLLKELSGHLIDIHSQHQNLLLNEERFQLDILDTIAGNADIRKEYAAHFKTWKAAEKAYRDFMEKVEREKNNYDYLSFQLSEIDNARLNPDEQKELEEESMMLENAETIKQGLYNADRLLSAEDEGIGSKLNDCVHTLRNLAEVYPEARQLSERVDSCAIELDDIAQEVSDKLENFSFEPHRLDEVNDRLSLIYALEKKHRCDDIGSLLSYAESLRSQIGDLENSEDVALRLKAEADHMKQSTLRCAARLTSSRRQAAHAVEKGMEERLRPLGMPNVHFEVSLTPLSHPEESGADAATFRFSANKNTPLQDIAQVASGGEIARVMLSLKAMLTAQARQSTIIFDEIDTGVSGRIAEKMALMMKEMSQSGRQVISITHLPQIAALGQYQYKVYKEDGNNATTTHIRELTPEERVTEIAHLLSGEHLTDAAISNAKELLNPKTL